jgi:hypothetical protein
LTACFKEDNEGEKEAGDDERVDGIDNGVIDSESVDAMLGLICGEDANDDKEEEEEEEEEGVPPRVAFFNADFKGCFDEKEEMGEE